MKSLTVALMLFSLSSYAGVIESGNESVEFKFKNENKVFTEYCNDENCLDVTFTYNQFSERMDEVNYFIEEMYYDKEFFERHVNQSYSDYKENKDNIWILDFEGVLSFTVDEEQINDVIEAKEKILSVLYGFHGRLNSEEVNTKFREFNLSNEKIKSYNNKDFDYYKTISKIMINKVKNNV